MSVKALYPSVLQLSVLVLAFGVSACVRAEEPEESSISSAIGCSIIFCTENAATAGDGLLFDELDLFGSQNYAGTAMLGAHLGTGTHPAVKILIFGDELWAFDPITSAWYSGTQLLKTIIDFIHVPSGVHFQIRVEDYQRQAATFMSGAHDPVPVYAFKARRDLTPGNENFRFNVCSDGVSLLPDPTWAGFEHYALVYRGDRYDPGHKRVLPNNPGLGWSFLACNGSAASKLHLWRHTYAGGFDSLNNPIYMTTLDERTALLKAITSDFCGTGSPTFTTTGTPIAFATAKEPLAFPFPRPPMAPMRSLDAMWGPNGALCIDHPRREFFGITKAYVETACGRTFDPCTPDATWPPAGWWGTHHAVTANPL